MLIEKVTDHCGAKPQRSRGTSRMIVQRRDTSTRLEDLFQQGCTRIRMPKTFDAQRIEAVMINTAGGITGGDEINWEFTARQGTHLTVTSQACERLYRSSGGVASINVKLKAQSSSTLNWLPQETILFDHCAAHRKINVDIEGDARLLMVEPVIFGRAAMGETVHAASFRDDWQIRHDGNLIHVEASRFDGQIAKLLTQKAVMNNDIAMATVLLLAPASAADLEAKAKQAQQIIQHNGGASLWNVGSTGKLLARVVASNGYELRKILIPLIGLLNDEAALPKTWAI